MSGHEIIWTFGGDAITARVVCNEEPGADCRLTSASQDCDCEYWGPIERREDGTIWHALTDGYRDLDLPRDVTQWHEIKLSDACNVAECMNGDPYIIPELNDGDEAFEIGTTRIATSWDGDCWLWTVDSSIGGTS